MSYSGTNRPIRRFLSIKQMRQLLDAIPLESPFGRRDYLLIMLLYHTGLRVGEVSQLTLSHVLTKRGQLREFLDLPAILCKGPRGRVVPLNTTAQACVSKLIKFGQPNGFLANQ
jgi:site-specific recombinase XerD